MGHYFPAFVLDLVWFVKNVKFMQLLPGKIYLHLVTYLEVYFTWLNRLNLHSKSRRTGRCQLQPLHSLKSGFDAFGQHVEQNSLPHFRQWCLLLNMVKSSRHLLHLDDRLSGTHCGSLGVSGTQVNCSCGWRCAGRAPWGVRFCACCLGPCTMVAIIISSASKVSSSKYSPVSSWMNSLNISLHIKRY